MAALNKKYFYELNFIRGVACLMVVMVHVTARHYHLNEDTFNWFTLFLNQITRFGTPLFAVIGGFLLFRQSINGNFSVGRFVQTRVKKIIIPFVIWSFVYLWIRKYVFPWEVNGKSYSDFFTMFLQGDSYGHLYFISMIIQFYLLFIVLQYIKKENVLWFFTIFSLLLTYFFMRQPIDFGNEVINVFLHDRSSLLFWLFYFFIGGVFAFRWEELTNWCKKNIHLSIWVMVLLFVCVTYEYDTFGRFNSTRISNLLFIPVIFLCMTSLYHVLNGRKIIQRFFVHLGNLSMGIYLVHPLVLHLLKEYMPFILERTRYIGIAFVLVMVVSVCIVLLIQKLPFGSYVVTTAGKQRTLTTKKKEIT